METLKKINRQYKNPKVIFQALTIIVFAISMQVSAQESKYNQLAEAFKQSYVAEQEKNFAKGIKILEQYYDEKSYEINLRLGWLSHLNGEQLKSKNYYAIAINLKPYAIEPKLGMTYPVYAIGETEELINCYKAILKIAPQNTIALYNLGLVYFYDKEYEKADTYFTKVVDLFPFDYDGLIMLAHTCFHLKKYREAKVLYHKVLLYNPDDPAALESLKLLNQE